MVISGPWAALDDLFEYLAAMLSFRFGRVPENNRRDFLEHHADIEKKLK